MKPSSKDSVAIFDFDKTLTYRDTFFPFLMGVAGKKATLLALCSLIPSFIGYAFGKISRHQIKESLLTLLLRHRTVASLRVAGKAYALEKIPPSLKPEAMERLNWHQQQGHRCVLVSASLSYYLEPWGKSVGFEKIICTQLEVNSFHQITGRMARGNCWGAEKLRRLKEYLDPLDSHILYVYGDSRGDKEILEVADYPFFRKFS